MIDGNSVNSEDSELRSYPRPLVTLDAAFPWCAPWADELRALFRAYVEAKLARNILDYDDLLLYWRHMMAEPANHGLRMAA